MREPQNVSERMIVHLDLDGNGHCIFACCLREKLSLGDLTSLLWWNFIVGRNKFKYSNAERIFNMPSSNSINDSTVNYMISIPHPLSIKLTDIVFKIKDH